MSKLELDFKTGKLFIDNYRVLPLYEREFVLSSFYIEYAKKCGLKRVSKYQHALDNVLWMDKIFLIWFNPATEYDNCFRIQLIDKDGEFFSALDDWDKRVDLTMLDNELKHSISWLEEILPITTTIDTTPQKLPGMIWKYTWGDIAVQCENKINFTFGIYFSWDL